MVGEILAGVLLGSTLLGASLSEMLIPVAVRPTLNVIATLGLLLFMFIAGLEFDLNLVRGRMGQAGVLALFSVGVPAFELLSHPVYISHEYDGLAQQ